MTTVIFKPQKLFPPRNSAITFSQSKHGSINEDFSLTLKAGANIGFSDTEISQLRSHPDFPQYEQWGALEIVEAKTTVDSLPPKSELSSLSEDNAIAVIENTSDAKQLAEWLKSEQRVNIRRTINTRITNIKKGKE
jgi:hypothetical protein